MDAYYGGGRLSRVDSYVKDMDSKYEYQMPSAYGTYRSSSRSNVPGYSTVNGYTVSLVVPLVLSLFPLVSTELHESVIHRHRFDASDEIVCSGYGDSVLHAQRLRGLFLQTDRQTNTHTYIYIYPYTICRCMVRDGSIVALTSLMWQFFSIYFFVVNLRFFVIVARFQMNVAGSHR